MSRSLTLGKQIVRLNDFYHLFHVHVPALGTAKVHTEKEQRTTYVRIERRGTKTRRRERKWNWRLQFGILGRQISSNAFHQRPCFSVVVCMHTVFMHGFLSERSRGSKGRTGRNNRHFHGNLFRTGMGFPSKLGLVVIFTVVTGSSIPSIC